MAKGKFYESDYEEAFVDLLQQNGWEYTFGDDLHRQYDLTLIEDDMRTYLQRRYAYANLTTAEIDAIIANLRNIGEPSLYHTSPTLIRHIVHRLCKKTKNFSRPYKGA